MSGYQVIARKYRPRTFDDVVGQGAVARTLRNAIEAGRVAHAYMFCGPRGVGKTSMARILARALNCLSFDAPTPTPCGTCDLCVAAAAGEDLDVFEMDAASNRKVDDARSLIGNVAFHPARARFKVYIVDEVHMLTTEAFNALLKTLEEPPPHVKFVFATTDPQKVPATILSRCQRFDFRPIPTADIAELLRGICASEGIAYDDDALVAVARAAAGGARDAESLLEQLTTLGRGAVRLDDLHALLGTVSGERMRALFDAAAAGDVGGALGVAAAVLDAGTDPGELLRQCMRHAHDLILVKLQGARAAGVVADGDARQALAEQAAAFSEATLAYAVTLFSEALKNARLLGEGRLFAETALARLAGHRELRYLDQIVRDLTALERRIGGDDGSGGSGGGARGGGPPAVRPAPAGGGGGPARAPSAPDGGTPGSAAPRASAESAASAAPAPAASDSSGAGGAAAAANGHANGQRAVAAPVLAQTAAPVAAPGSGAAAEEPPRPARPGSGISRPTGAEEPAELADDGDVPAHTADLWESATPADGGGTPESAFAARWGDVRDAARQQSSRLMAHLQPARVERVDGETLVLSFPRSQAFHRSAVEGGELRDALREAFRAVFGRRLDFRTVERDDDPEPGPGSDETARPRDVVSDRLTASEVEAARSAALTKLAERELGARIVHLERDV